MGIVLRNHGYRVLEALGGTHALGICAQHDGPIHLLLTDVQMPDLCGPALASRVLTLRPHTLILYMSADPEEALLSRAGVEPAVVFIQKPFTSDALAQKVRDVLDLRPHNRPS